MSGSHWKKTLPTTFPFSSVFPTKPSGSQCNLALCLQPLAKREALVGLSTCLEDGGIGGRNQNWAVVGEVIDTYLSIYLKIYLSIYLCLDISSYPHHTHWAAVLTETPCFRSAPEAGRQALPDHRAHQHEAGVAGKDGRGAERRLSANLLPAGRGRQLAAGYDWESATQSRHSKVLAKSCFFSLFYGFFQGLRAEG